jgi:hypothetical protein
VRHLAADRKTVNKMDLARYQVLMAASIKFTVFWDVALCSHVEVDRCFRSAYCFHHQSNETAVAVC